MLRFFVLLILLAGSFSAKCKSSKNSFRSLTIGFIYGDEAMSYEELRFKKTGNKIMGRISQPGRNEVPVSDVACLSCTACIFEMTRFSQYYTLQLKHDKSIFKNQN